MPLIPSTTLPNFDGLTLNQLLELGKVRMSKFCKLNGIDPPMVTEVPKSEWWFDACAYYRPDQGIVICTELCAKSGGEERTRNWNWPGNTTDRTPYGVIAHELGHHVDRLSGNTKYAYASDFSELIKEKSGEAPLTSYAPNPAEWFAEHFRLFVTNPDFLRLVRPKTYALFFAHWNPATTRTWSDELGLYVPDRFLEVGGKKIKEAERRRK